MLVVLKLAVISHFLLPKKFVLFVPPLSNCTTDRKDVNNRMYRCIVLLSTEKRNKKYYTNLLKIEKEMAHEAAQGD